MSSEPSTQLKPTSAVAGGTAADLADPVSPLSTPDQGTGTAVLERPETEEQTDRSDNGDATGSRTMCRAIASPNRSSPAGPWSRCAARSGCRSTTPSQYPVCPDCKRIYEEMMK